MILQFIHDNRHIEHEDIMLNTVESKKLIGHLKESDYRCYQNHINIFSNENESLSECVSRIKNIIKKI